MPVAAVKDDARRRTLRQHWWLILAIAALVWVVLRLLTSGGDQTTTVVQAMNLVGTLPHETVEVNSRHANLAAAIEGELQAEQAPDEIGFTFLHPDDARYTVFALAATAPSESRARAILEAGSEMLAADAQAAASASSFHHLDDRRAAAAREHDALTDELVALEAKSNTFEGEATDPESTELAQEIWRVKTTMSAWEAQLGALDSEAEPTSTTERALALESTSEAAVAPDISKSMVSVLRIMVALVAAIVSLELLSRNRAEASNLYAMRP